jgi:uncharacterized RDD family membrane protein YckC
MSTIDRSLYAGFWRRFVAYAIDYALVIGASLGALLSATVLGLGPERQTELSLALIVGYFLYCTLLESSPWQATLGKRAVGLKVETRDGRRIGFGRATARFFAKLLSAFTLLVGYALIVFTARRQALHDVIAGTVVVHERLPPKVPALAIAVLASGACLPVIGVVAAIAVPAYRDYAIRAQVTEGLRLADGFRSALEAAWRDSPREFADFNVDSLDAELASSGRFVESVEFVSGMIVITYGRAADGSIAGRVLALVPALDGHDALGWACGYGQPPVGFEVVFDGHAGYTDIPERYIPSRCRRSPRP